MTSTMTGKNTILFIHGAWHGGWCWHEHFIPFFSDAGYSCFSLNLPEHQEGNFPLRLNKLGLHNYVEAVEKKISVLPSKPILVGHSLGGYIIQKLLGIMDFPAAILLAPVPYYGPLFTLFRFLRRNFRDSMRVLVRKDISAILDSVDKYGELFYYSLKDRELMQKYFSRLSGESLYAMAATLINYPHVRQEMSTPLLFLGGEEDRFFTRLDILRTAKRYKADAILLENTGHGIMLEPGWEDAAQSIHNWLRNLIR